MKLSISLPYLCSFLVFSGCAGVRVQPINTAEDEEHATGVRYYESSPYLLVHTDNAGGLTGKVIHLPDPNKKRSAKPFAYLAKNDVTLDFSHGVLTSAVSEQDGMEFPAAVVDALTKVAGAAVGAAFNAPRQDTLESIPAPYLFKIVVQGDSIGLIGDPRSPSSILFQ